MRTAIVLSISLLLVLAVVIPDGLSSAGAENELEAEAARDAEEEAEREAKEEDELDIEDVEQFDRNIKIDFKMAPAEDHNQGTFVVTATPAFATSTFYKGAEGSIDFEVSGQVLPRDDGRLFLRYEATATAQGGHGEAEFYVYAGVLLKPGKELKTSRMGDRTLIVSASYLEEEKKE